MLQLLVPPNVMMLFNIIIPIIGWDMLDGVIDWETQNVFKYTRAEAPFPGQTEELGYEASNWVVNMNSVAILLFFITFKLILYIVLKAA